MESSSSRSSTKSIVNFGPQHPAAHGVLRLILQLNGEVVERTDVHIGLLHRGTEKLVESKHYEKALPYFDRLDYVSMMTQEHAYCIGVEYLLNKKTTNVYVNMQRILFDELTRILNHMLAIACHALDVGSMSSIFWSFEEREKLMEFYERVSGARMHAAYNRPNDVFKPSLNHKLLEDMLFFIKNCHITLNEMHNMLTYNKIWKQRLINIGTYGIADVHNFGLTGVMARCVGLSRDLRLDWKSSYSDYNSLFFKSFVTYNGDCYDRFLIRMFEMGESLHIMNQAIGNIFRLSNTDQSGLNLNYAHTEVFNTVTKKVTPQTNSYHYMEDLIDHFISWHRGVTVESGFTQLLIESPKGEFGVTLVSDSSASPARCKIRSPSYHNLQFLPKLAKGHLLGDLAALIGTIDIVFGEVDR